MAWRRLEPTVVRWTRLVIVRSPEARMNHDISASAVTRRRLHFAPLRHHTKQKTSEN
ncbi:MAG: hypothetical protein AAB602_02235 [Patescibacteria group bacterium]